MKREHSPQSLQERLPAWVSRLLPARPHSSAATNSAARKTEPTKTNFSNPNSPPKSRTTLQTISNVWGSAIHRLASENSATDTAEPAFSGAPEHFDVDAAGKRGGVGLTRWLRSFTEEPEWRTKRKEIDRTRSGLQQVDLSLQDLNRRIEHLETIADRWQRK